MKTDVFIARLARSAAVTAMSGAWLAPQNQTAAVACPPKAEEMAYPDRAVLPASAKRDRTAEAVVVTLRREPSEWTKRMEREFRRLALEEAKGSLSAVQGTRLEELSRWRNHLLHGPTAEETLLQLKRDRLLTRMEDLLKEYVQFQEGADQAGATA